MNKPSVTEGIGFINYAWPELKLRVMAERYNDEGYAELSFYLNNETGENLVHTTRANLLATPTMNSLTKRLEGNSQDIPWLDILTYITGKTLEIARRGELVKAIGKKPETMKVEYQLFPILERNEPTTIYSPGGYGKSYLAAYIACLVQFNQQGLHGWTPIQGNVLYLDWESSSQDHDRRVWAIKQGLRIKTEETFLYLFCHQPLAADIHRIQRIIAEGKVSLLIVDSQMAAEGYGPHPAQVSSQYYNALRSLHCTSLTLDHVSKAEWGKVADADSLGPYGSVVKFNRSRSQFEIAAKSQTPGEDFMELALVHQKHNEGKLLKKIGIRIDFQNNGDELEKVTFTDCDISENPDLSKVQSLRDRLAGILGGGTMPLKDLAEAVDKPENTVRATLNRHKDTFVKVGQEWGLKAYES
jgi:hypothetical protein